MIKIKIKMLLIYSQYLKITKKVKQNHQQNKIFKMLKKLHKIIIIQIHQGPLN